MITYCTYVTGKPLLTTKEYTCDTDTTSVALTVLRRDKKIAFPIMDEILVDLVDADGIILVSGRPSLPFARQHNLKITRHISTPNARGLIPRFV